MDVAVVPREIVGPLRDDKTLREDAPVEPLTECRELALSIREVCVHGTNGHAGSFCRLPRRQLIASRFRELLDERFEDRFARRRRLRFPLRAGVRARFGRHCTNSMPCPPATRTMPGTSGGVISTFAETSLKNVAALPFVVIVRKWHSVRLR